MAHMTVGQPRSSAGSFFPFQRETNTPGGNMMDTFSNPLVTAMPGGAIEEGVRGIVMPPDVGMRPGEGIPTSVATVQQFFLAATPTNIANHIVMVGMGDKSLPHYTLLPPRKAENKDIAGYSVGQLEFGQQPPSVVPEGVSARVISHKWSEKHVRHQRHGQAIRISHDMISTGYGIELFNNYMKVLASNAAILGQMVITSALTRCKDKYRMKRREHIVTNGKFVNGSNASKVMAPVGEINRHENAINKLITFAQWLGEKEHGVQFTHALCTETVMKLSAYGGEKSTEFYRMGSKGPKILDQGPFFFERNKVSGIQLVREPTYNFSRVGTKEDVNLLCHNIEVGRHYIMVKGNMVSPNPKIPFDMTADLGFLNLDVGDGVVETQPYLDLLNACSVWDHSTGGLYYKYDEFVRNDAQKLRHFVKETFKFNLPDNDRGGRVDPFIGWLPGSEPYVVNYLGEQDVKYTSLDDQAMIVDKVVKKLKRETDTDTMFAIQRVLELSEDWHNPKNIPYTERFLYAVWATNVANGNASFSDMTSIPDVISANGLGYLTTDGTWEGVVCENVSSPGVLSILQPNRNSVIPLSDPNIASDMKIRLSIAHGGITPARQNDLTNYLKLLGAIRMLSPHMTVIGNLDELVEHRASKIVVDEERTKPTRRGKQELAERFGVIAKIDHLPGFSTYANFMHLASSNSQLISKDLKPIIVKGVNGIREIMQVLANTFSCEAAPNYFFDPAQNTSFGGCLKSANHKIQCTNAGASNILFGRKLETAFNICSGDQDLVDTEKKYCPQQTVRLHEESSSFTAALEYLTGCRGLRETIHRGAPAELKRLFGRFAPHVFEGNMNSAFGPVIGDDKTVNHFVPVIIPYGEVERLPTAGEESRYEFTPREILGEQFGAAQGRFGVSMLSRDKEHFESIVRGVIHSESTKNLVIGIFDQLFPGEIVSMFDEDKYLFSKLVQRAKELSERTAGKHNKTDLRKTLRKGPLSETFSDNVLGKNDVVDSLEFLAWLSYSAIEHLNYAKKNKKDLPSFDDTIKNEAAIKFIEDKINTLHNYLHNADAEEDIFLNPSAERDAARRARRQGLDAVLEDLAQVDDREEESQIVGEIDASRDVAICRKFGVSIGGDYFTSFAKEIKRLCKIYPIQDKEGSNRGKFNDRNELHSGDILMVLFILGKFRKFIEKVPESISHLRPTGLHGNVIGCEPSRDFGFNLIFNRNATAYVKMDSLSSWVHLIPKSTNIQTEGFEMFQKVDAAKLTEPSSRTHRNLSKNMTYGISTTDSSFSDGAYSYGKEPGDPFFMELETKLQGEGSSSIIGIDPNFKSRFWAQRLANGRAYSVDLLRRAINYAYCGTRVHRNAFAQMYASGIPVPIGFLVVDLFCRFVTSAIIFVVGNGSCGFVSYALPDVMHSTDADHKMHSWTLTFYIGALVTDERNVLIMSDAVLEGYRGGCSGRLIKTGTGDERTGNAVATYINTIDMRADFNPQTRARIGDRFCLPIGFSRTEKDFDDHIVYGGTTANPRFQLCQWIPSELMDSSISRNFPFDSAIMATARFEFHHGFTRGDRVLGMEPYSDESGDTGNNVTSKGDRWWYEPSTEKYTQKIVAGVGAMGSLCPGAKKAIDGSGPIVDVIKGYTKGCLVY